MKPQVQTQVAIIGAGPAGIAAAKWLRQAGLQPVLFEQSDQAGGQWNVGNAMSGIWPGMPTNTSRVMTQFSDFEHAPDVPVFPLAGQVHDYLLRYLRHYGLSAHLRAGCRVERLAMRPQGDWLLHYRDAASELREQTFTRVIVASGRFNQPVVPRIPGIHWPPQARQGCEVLHSQDYRGAAACSGRRVLVLGGAISSLEIASDLALHGAHRLVCSYRSQAYVMGKLAGTVPTDHISYSLYEALAAERLDSARNAHRIRDFIVAQFGSPADHGAQLPAADLRTAGVTKCEDFLRLVSAGRITVRPWVERMEDGHAVFPDGSVEAFDTILLATGYRPAMPFLAPCEHRVLQLDQGQVTLYRHTFHPELPGLAVLGFYNQSGPYFPVLELQARWVASVWSGRMAAPRADDMRRQLAEYSRTGAQPRKFPMHVLALLFARAIGAEPDPRQWRSLERSLWFGPLCAAVFRLSGPDALDDAPERVRNAAGAFGLIRNETFSPEERLKLVEIGA